LQNSNIDVTLSGHFTLQAYGRLSPEHMVTVRYYYLLRNY
jgi:hypothetical protein